jgi:hypothetical protein
METIKTKKIIPVQAPCLIAYRDPLAGYFWLRPYVDMGLKSKIWGIAVNGQVFKLVHEEDGNWYQAKKLGDTKINPITQKEHKITGMPTTTVIDIASYWRREFDKTVQLLQNLGIKAETWRNGWYWTTEDNGDDATVMDMANGRIEFQPKKMRNGYIRLISNYIVKKPDVMDYPLAYLVDGHLEIANDFRPELRDKLWGLHVSKRFLCMKLTYEPNKMTVDKGFALGQSLSTSQLKVDLPEKEIVDDIAKEKDSINDTLAKLSAYGANVDLIFSKDLIWLTKTLYEDRGFLSYNYSFVLKDQACLCRMFAKNKGKTVVI